jgi:hypothetical protein
LVAIVALLLLSFLAIVGVVSLPLPVHSQWFLLVILSACFALALCYSVWGVKFSEVRSEQHAL